MTLDHSQLESLASKTQRAALDLELVCQAFRTDKRFNLSTQVGIAARAGLDAAAAIRSTIAIESNGNLP